MGALFRAAIRNSSSRFHCVQLAGVNGGKRPTIVADRTAPRRVILDPPKISRAAPTWADRNAQFVPTEALCCYESGHAPLLPPNVADAPSAQRPQDYSGHCGLSERSPIRASVEGSLHLVFCRDQTSHLRRRDQVFGNPDQFVFRRDLEAATGDLSG